MPQRIFYSYNRNYRPCTPEAQDSSSSDALISITPPTPPAPQAALTTEQMLPAIQQNIAQLYAAQESVQASAEIIMQTSDETLTLAESLHLAGFILNDEDNVGSSDDEDDSDEISMEYTTLGDSDSEEDDGDLISSRSASRSPSPRFH